MCLRRPKFPDAVAINIQIKGKVRPARSVTRSVDMKRGSGCGIRRGERAFGLRSRYRATRYAEQAKQGYENYIAAEGRVLVAHDELVGAEKRGYSDA